MQELCTVLIKITNLYFHKIMCVAKTLNDKTEYVTFKK